MEIKEHIEQLRSELPVGATLVAVSKTYPPETIMQAYGAGQRVFGENRPQELKAKYESLPKDIRWHMIGHLQTNKVKYVVPIAELIHSVDSRKLMAEIDRQAKKIDRTVDVLIEVRIADEETKHGWDEASLTEYMASGIQAEYKNVRVRGLMGIATNTDDVDQIRREFMGLRELYDKFRAQDMGDCQYFDTLSMGMTSDYKIALECGSTMVRIGSLIFGSRRN